MKSNDTESDGARNPDKTTRMVVERAWPLVPDGGDGADEYTRDDGMDVMPGR